MRDAYDEPASVAAAIDDRPRPLLLGFDVDGVLAPLVDHADDARLLDGVLDALGGLAGQGHHVAIVSGRSMADLARFAFPAPLIVVGSHGLEVLGGPLVDLDDDDRARLAVLDALAVTALATAGEGAWVERKPASVVLHVRRAVPELADRAVSQLRLAAAAVPGASEKAGSGVLEVFARHADKGTALVAVAAAVGAATVVFAGDDVTDEDAFARLSSEDVTIKVGDAPTIARHRLADPVAVRSLLQHLTNCDTVPGLT
jgi:trehalose-phosphatase